MQDNPEIQITEAHMSSLGYLISRLQGQMRTRLVAALEGTGLHGGHVIILATLWTRCQQAGHESGLTQTQLVQITGIEKSSIVLFLDALEKDGWLARHRHATDRRAHNVRMTESGLRRFNDVGTRLSANEQAALAVFNETEAKQLMSYLTRLHTHLKYLDS